MEVVPLTKLKTLIVLFVVAVTVGACAGSDMGNDSGIHVAFVDSERNIVCYHDHGNSYGGDALSCVKY